ncbi:N-acyl homoserine lactonase family protein [Ammoniphilus resinae]|uniref:Glyoxylase-like metal-dependent hydrolase (Beta-lactamase superfamily II) n=1 Tax=Ammoniphilus resinae TaxID=861532 RepID=A0ABS4GPI3_9BACL|nr:N-acyl homoserine lactonase family protein [Ammoniphilus resinae]MBP1932175.1 glyoxylase-like metal-dependent hydrolase (beta-lactamase superfamily II) [Ammoniphilus resinae]
MSDFPIIKPLHVGILQNIEKSQFVYGRHHGIKIEVPCIMFVIEVAGKKVVVDTGPCKPDRARQYHGPLIQDESMYPENALKSIGVHPDEVDYVILSHLHWDHCSNCKMFKNATFIVQKTELQYAITPNEVQKAQYEIGFREILPPWIDVLQQMQTVSGDVYDFLKGVHLISLPGHSPGLMGVAVETRKDLYLIASDCVPLMENWHGDARMRHIPNGLHIDLAEYERSFEKMERLGGIVLAGHDYETLKYKQYPPE